MPGLEIFHVCAGEGVGHGELNRCRIGHPTSEIEGEGLTRLQVVGQTIVHLDVLRVALASIEIRDRDDFLEAIPKAPDATRLLRHLEGLSTSLPRPLNRCSLLTSRSGSLLSVC